VREKIEKTSAYTRPLEALRKNRTAYSGARRPVSQTPLYISSPLMYPSYVRSGFSEGRTSMEAKGLADESA
jgi:hypothetical protein